MIEGDMVEERADERRVEDWEDRRDASMEAVADDMDGDDDDDKKDDDADDDD